MSKELNNAWVNVTEIAKKLEIVYSSLDIAKDNLSLNTFSYNEGDYRSWMYFLHR
ncbi:MAG: hypothetical protein V8S95_06420 [Odoribacter sp.]